MTVTGIIAEYNPFHNGHFYQINKAKENGADSVIVVMSGDFVQRGIPAVMDKYSRAKMALLNGADMVLELPTLYATGSAQYFARGAVSILDKLGVVDKLTFGCETAHPDLLVSVARFLLEEPDSYKELLQKGLKNGLSFPKAREVAIESLLGCDAAALLSTPNNILAVEYVMALLQRNSSIQVNPIKREGSGYHDEQLTDGVHASASAIRRALEIPDNFETLQKHVPESVYEILKANFNHSFPVCANDFSDMLHYKLLSSSDDYTIYGDIGNDFSSKIKNNLYNFSSWDEFCDLLKSKDITHSKISRSLCHILLDIQESDYDLCKETDYASYVRVLGFSPKGKELFSKIKKNSPLSFILQVREDMDKVSNKDKALFGKDLLASHIYQSIISKKFNTAMKNEFQRKIIT